MGPCAGPALGLLVWLSPASVRSLEPRVFHAAAESSVPLGRAIRSSGSMAGRVEWRVSHHELAVGPIEDRRGDVGCVRVGSVSVPVDAAVACDRLSSKSGRGLSSAARVYAGERDPAVSRPEGLLAPASLLELTDADFWVKVGKDTASAFADRTRWLYRRVESMEFDASVNRQISVDFEIPRALPSLEDRAAPDTWLVPISVFPKWPPLMDFSFIGADGLPTSLYTRTTNKRLDFGLVLGMAELALGAASMVNRELTADLLIALEALVMSDQVASDDLERVVRGLRSELQEKLRVELEAESQTGGTQLAHKIAATVDLAGQLSASSVLWVAVTGSPGTDRIVKFSYVDRYRPSFTRTHRRRAALQTACSWRSINVLIPLPHAGTRTRFHLDVHTPHGGVQLISTDLIALPSSGDKGSGEAPVVKSLDALAVESKDIDPPDEYVGPKSSHQFLRYGAPILLASSSDPDAGPVLGGNGKPVTSARITDRRAHIYLGAGASPSHRVMLQVKLGATRQGFITGCLLAALALAALMTAAFVDLEAAALHLDATVVLFSLVPVVLGYVVVRPEEGALEHMQIAGVRILALIAGAMPIVGALALVLTHHNSTIDTSPDLTVAEPIWIGLLAISWLAALGLFSSWRLAASPQEAE